MWLPKKTQLLGWSESLKRSGTELPADFDQRLTALRSKWDQLEVGLSLFGLLYEHDTCFNCNKGVMKLYCPIWEMAVKSTERHISQGFPLWKESAS